MIFPVSDESPRRYFPFVNYLLIAGNIAIYFFLRPVQPQALQQFYFDFGLLPQRVVQEPFYLFNYVTFFTSMFIHGGLFHLLGNMLYLWIAGDNIEFIMGHRRYFLFYLTVGVLAGITQVAMQPASGAPMVGASGAISGVLGAYLLKFPRNRIGMTIFFLFYFRVPAVIVLTAWFLMQLSSGYFALTPEAGGGVAYFAHIGGFVAGFLLVKLFEIKR